MLLEQRLSAKQLVRIPLAPQTSPGASHRCSENDLTKEMGERERREGQDYFRSLTKNISEKKEILGKSVQSSL